jgi:glycosyltransferase involved in cell wall biosynthesis
VAGVPRTPLRVLFVSRTRYTLPLDRPLERKFAALRDELEVRVLACAPDGASRGDGTFSLVPPLGPRRLEGLLFQLALPPLVAREVRRFQPDVVFADGTHRTLATLLGRRLALRQVPVVLEVHGDWRAVTRLYGSRLRRLLDPIADRLSVAAVRRADAVRTLSAATSRLVREHGIEPAASFPAYVDVDTFLARPPRPLPDEPQALFVGVLERYKNVDGLVAAWRAAAPRLPGARLRIVGDGPLRGLVERLCRDLPEQTSWEPQLETPAIARALDESSVLVLPSRSEGLPRVVIEALCRGRPVLATPVGGVPDLIDDGVNGFLLPSDDAQALAEGLVRVLGLPGALEPAAAEARESVRPWVQSPLDFAARVADLAWAATRGGAAPAREEAPASARAA